MPITFMCPHCTDTDLVWVFNDLYMLKPNHQTAAYTLLEIFFIAFLSLFIGFPPTSLLFLLSHLCLDLFLLPTSKFCKIPALWPPASSLLHPSHSLGDLILMVSNSICTLMTPECMPFTLTSPWNWNRRQGVRVRPLKEWHSHRTWQTLVRTN